MSSRPPPHPDLAFRRLGSSAGARAGRFETPHGAVETPAFIPVATQGALKGLTQSQIENAAPELLLANTYHLHLRPGEDVIRRLGGLHGFTGWRRPWLTDSGGYQVFSLSERVRIEEDGVRLRSHLDGTEIRLGPRRVIEIQEALGADVIMAFDHCVGLPAEREVLADAVERTTRWTRACVAARTRADQALFGIVQGGTDPELRARSARDLVELDLPGYAIGGLAVGEGSERLRAAMRMTAPLLPADRPRYLMGVGQPLDLLDAIAAGIDLFDCVLPTRNGRRGWLYTSDGTVRIGARLHSTDDAPIDAECACEVCRAHSRAYLRHLFKVGDHTAVALGTLHNVAFIVGLVRRAREAILADRFEAFRSGFAARFEAGEQAWREAHEADPEAAARSRAAWADRQARAAEDEPG